MKRGESIKVGWKEIIKDGELLVYEPPGFSTAEQIANAKKIRLKTAWYILKKLRDEGKIEAKKGLTKEGKSCWFYKD